MKNRDAASKIDLSDLDEPHFFDWVVAHAKKIIMGVVSLLLATLLFLWIFYGSSFRSNSEYTAAATAYQSLQKGSSGALKQLSSILSSEPELQSKYDGIVAQTLLNQGLVKEAEPFATRNLDRVKKDNLPLYNDYAETTLLIANKENDEALKRARTLRGKMFEELSQQNGRSFGDTLLAANLLRIAFLEQLLGHSMEEKAAWQEWSSFAKNDPSVAQYKVQASVFTGLENEIKIGNITLGNYIQTRLTENK